MGVRAENLQAGKTYFVLFYADGRREKPVVETFVYIGSDFRPAEAGAHDTQYQFQFARSFYQQGDWNQMTMDERDEYVEAPVVTFDAKSLAHVFDHAGLVEELRRGMAA
jgi:hypothetical protein